MEQSETIGKLAEALAKSQGQITGARRDSENPYYKSKYSDLASVWDAIRGALSANGLSVVQVPYFTADGNVGLTTILMHSSGEYIKGNMEMKPAKNDPQALGSVISYLRRYCISAFVGVAQVDDDGNAASQVPFESKAVTKKYDMHPGEPKDVPAHLGEEKPDPKEIILDLKKQLATMMSAAGIKTKDSQSDFFNWFMFGRDLTVDNLLDFKDNFMRWKGEYLKAKERS